LLYFILLYCDFIKMRDRRKKDVHNMSNCYIFIVYYNNLEFFLATNSFLFLCSVERKRRYSINDKIRELGTLLPKSCFRYPPNRLQTLSGYIEIRVFYNILISIALSWKRLNLGFWKFTTFSAMPNLAKVQFCERQWIIYEICRSMSEVANLVSSINYLNRRTNCSRSVQK